MKAVLVFAGIIFFSLVFIQCKNPEESISDSEENQIFETIIKLEEDSSWGKIASAKYGAYYLLNDRFTDSIFLYDSAIHLIDNRISIVEIKEQYKNSLSKGNKLVTDSFHLLHLKEYSSKIPEFLSFSKPIKYLEYYFVNFCFYSWSSGYKSTFVLVKDTSGKYRPIYRRVYLIV